MTYKEKYRAVHPEVTQEQMEMIIQANCPDRSFDLEDKPDYCSSADSDEKVCPMCWEREFPQGVYDDQVIEKAFKFLAAQQKAEEKGEQSFVCPLCGGRAHWERAALNGHRRCSCDGCGMKFVE